MFKLHGWLRQRTAPLTCALGTDLLQADVLRIGVPVHECNRIRSEIQYGQLRQWRQTLFPAEGLTAELAEESLDACSRVAMIWPISSEIRVPDSG